MQIIELSKITKIKFSKTVLSSSIHTSITPESMNRQTISEHCRESNRKLTRTLSAMPAMGKMCVRGLVNINGFSHILIWASACDSMTVRNPLGMSFQIHSRKLNMGTMENTSL